MAVDQTRGKRDALGIDFGGRALAIQVSRLAPGSDLAAFRDQTIPVEDRVFQFAGEDPANVPDDKLFHSGLRAVEVVSIRISFG